MSLKYDPWKVMQVPGNGTANVASPANSRPDKPNISKISGISRRNALAMQNPAAISEPVEGQPSAVSTAQNRCAGCGVFIPVYDTNWVHLADGTLVHHGGPHGDKCKQDLQRNLSVVNFNKPKGSSV
jgi:hypothetical protein